MTGHPVRLFTAAAFAAAASLLSALPASANCGGCGFGYAAPGAYAAPVAYSVSYAAPMSYGVGGGNPCGGGFCFRYAPPSYNVEQRPAHDAPGLRYSPPAP